MPRKTYKSESDAVLPTTPPHHLGTIASAMWRKMVPVLPPSKIRYLYKKPSDATYAFLTVF